MNEITSNRRHSGDEYREKTEDPVGPSSFPNPQDPTRKGHFGTSEVALPEKSPSTLKRIDSSDLIRDEYVPPLSPHTITQVSNEPKIPLIPLEQQQLIDSYQKVEQESEEFIKLLREFKSLLNLVTERDQEILNSLKPFVIDSDEWGRLFANNTAQLFDRKLIPNTKQIPIHVKDKDGNLTMTVPTVIPLGFKTTVLDPNRGPNNSCKILQDDTQLTEITPEARKKLKQELQQALEHCYAEISPSEEKENTEVLDSTSHENEQPHENQNLVKIRNFFKRFDKDEDLISVKDIATLLGEASEGDKNLLPPLHEALNQSLKFKSEILQHNVFSPKDLEDFKQGCFLSLTNRESPLHQLNQNLETIWDDLPKPQQEFLTALYHGADAAARKAAVIGTTVGVGGVKLTALPFAGSLGLAAVSTNPVGVSIACGTLVGVCLMMLRETSIENFDDPDATLSNKGFLVGRIIGIASLPVGFLLMGDPAGIIPTLVNAVGCTFFGALPFAVFGGGVGGIIYKYGKSAGQAVNCYLQSDASSEQAKKSFAEFSEAFSKSCGRHLDDFLTTAQLFQEQNQKQLEKVEKFLAPSILIKAPGKGPLDIYSEASPTSIIKPSSRHPMLLAVAEKFKTYLEAQEKFYQRAIIALKKQIEEREEKNKKEGGRIDSKVYLRRALP